MDGERVGMARVVEHLGLAELRAGYRGSGDATLARHFQVIWLLAQGRTVAETARLTSFVRRWIEELLVRNNVFGPSSLGDRRRGDGAKARVLTAEVLDALRERMKRPPDGRGLDIEEGGGRHGGRARTGPGRRAARLGGAARDRLDDPEAAAAPRPRGDAR